MGGGQSSQQRQKEEQERQERAHAEAELRRWKIQDEERKHKQELEKQEKVRLAHEEELKIDAEREQMQALLKQEEQAKKLEEENRSKLAEYEHIQEMKRIEDMEEDNKRKDALNQQKQLNDKELFQITQERMFNILDATFAKVQAVDMNQAAMAVCVLQSIKAGDSLDKEVLKIVMSKVAPSPTTEDVVHQILDEVRKDEERFTDNSSQVIVERDPNRSSSPF